MNLTKVSITNNSHEELVILRNSLEKSIHGKLFFRYFEKRNFDYLNNHLRTFLFFIGNNCVGYSHLDKENDEVWLGIIVFDEYVGLGYGKKILKETISEYSGDILLSLDKINKTAFNLYKKFGFSIIYEDDKIYKMKLIN